MSRVTRKSLPETSEVAWVSGLPKGLVERRCSGYLGSHTLGDKTPAHWPRPTENWWSDPRSELLDWQNPETGPKLSADPRSTVFFKSANPLDLSPKYTIRELFKAKSADPRTYSPPSLLTYLDIWDMFSENGGERMTWLQFQIKTVKALPIQSSVSKNWK